MNNRNAKMQVLWIAPNLNHYKLSFLGFLAEHKTMAISILSGKQNDKDGHQYVENEKCEVNSVSTSKHFFAFDPRTFVRLLVLAKRKKPQIIMLPTEKKFLPLLLFTFLIRFWFRFKLVTYCHKSFKSAGRISFVDRLLSRFAFWLYDKVIIYTKKSRDWAVENKLVSASKATYASNTLDTSQIFKHADRSTRSLSSPAMLFIGRLTVNKRPLELIDYFSALLERIHNLQLHIIGDGPLKNEVIERLAGLQKNVTLHGGIGDEEELAPLFKNSNVVFVPGDSGLAVVHAFAYAKPFITVSDEKSNHGPELDYLANGMNGLILENEFETNVDNIAKLLGDEDKYQAFCHEAKKTGEELRIENWCSRIDTIFHELIEK